MWYKQTFTIGLRVIQVHTWDFLEFQTKSENILHTRLLTRLYPLYTLCPSPVMSELDCYMTDRLIGWPEEVAAFMIFNLEDFLVQFTFKRLGIFWNFPCLGTVFFLASFSLTWGLAIRFCLFTKDGWISIGMVWIRETAELSMVLCGGGRWKRLFLPRGAPWIYTLRQFFCHPRGNRGK